MIRGRQVMTDTPFHGEFRCGCQEKERVMAKYLRDDEHPAVLGYRLDRRTLTPIRTVVDRQRTGDYGADPIGDGTFRMVPSGDIVTLTERNARLERR